ncbi:MAG: hypothetical protein KGM49_02035 [Sphingomonadales bacterium]|nr:hypothetical protein [Sphingomonadales bacterium]
MKRVAIIITGIASLCLVNVAAQPAWAEPTAANRLFAPPADEMVLTRTVWRYLADGQQIKVTRSYAVRFLRVSDGFRLEGKLIGATVDAPADLAPFAELERNRPDTGLFPILLDANGRILADGVAPPPAARVKAADLARAALERAPLTSADRQVANQQVAAMGAEPGVYGHVPADLFQPQAGERREHRHIALPGGIAGEVDVAIHVDDIQPSGLPDRVERVMTTELAGTTRVSREVWTFASRL